MIQSALTNRMSQDLTVTLVEYPSDALREAIVKAVSQLYPSLDNWVIYLSDYTSSIPYRSRQEHPDIKISRANLEELYRRVLWLSETQITKYDECEDKSEMELRELADKDIEVLAKEISAKLNYLGEIKNVEFVIDRISDHIPTFSFIKSTIIEKEWISYETNEKRYYEIESAIDAEFGMKMFEKIKEACPNKEVVVNDRIDSTWKNLNTERRDYLNGLDLKSNCIIIDGHNRLGDSNIWTEFNFTNALSILPSQATVGCSMKTENRNDWEQKLMNTENRLSPQQLEELFTKELTTIISDKE